ncbi:hypothetical protein RJ639_026675 [Escallonia herrerae]|uniref:CCHC-type domain-containing protein n=1 Tax=Escallonia herrerae TaxID=1293975 RepID=A0AA88X3L6_9ASTE|nr:hypothetical protein RJ639_026675 [Escallonia herrerae]
MVQDIGDERVLMAIGGDGGYDGCVLERCGHVVEVNYDQLRSHCARWSNKLVSRFVKYRVFSWDFVQSIVDSYWHLHGAIGVLVVGMCFAFHFEDVRDLECLLEAGPCNIQVTVFIDDPLVAGAYLNTMENSCNWIWASYEKVFRVCYNCGVIGHVNIECPFSLHQAQQQKFFQPFTPVLSIQLLKVWTPRPAAHELRICLSGPFFENTTPLNKSKGFMMDFPSPSPPLLNLLFEPIPKQIVG